MKISQFPFAFLSVATRKLYALSFLLNNPDVETGLYLILVSYTYSLPSCHRDGFG